MPTENVKKDKGRNVELTIVVAHRMRLSFWFLTEDGLGLRIPFLVAFQVPRRRRRCPQSSHTQLMQRCRSHTTSSRFVVYFVTFCPTSSLTATSQVLKIQYQKEQAQAHITVQTKFNYAWGLVKSPMREHQVEGVRLLQGASYPIPVLSFMLKHRAHLAEIYRSEPGRRRECLYYLALGHYKMGNYDEAKKFNGVEQLFILRINRALTCHSPMQLYSSIKSPPTCKLKACRH